MGKGGYYIHGGRATCILIQEDLLWRKHDVITSIDSAERDFILRRFPGIRTIQTGDTTFAG